MKRLYVGNLTIKEMTDAAAELGMWRVDVRKDGPHHVLVLGSLNAVLTAVACAEQAVGHSLVVDADHRHPITGKDLDLGL